MKKLLIFSIFLLSLDSLTAQIKVSELSATPVDVLNNFYFKGGSLNGKYKLSLEKVMVNELFDSRTLDHYDNIKWLLMKKFTGISEDLFYNTSLQTTFNYNSATYNRIPMFVPQIFDKTELNILKGSSNTTYIKNIIGYVRYSNDNFSDVKNLFLTSTFDEINKKSPIIEILRDKLVEITDYRGLNDFYLLNSNTDLNNLGTKTVQLFLANENVKTEKEQYFDNKKLELDENDFLWRLFKVKDDVFLVLTFRDVRALNIPFPSFLDFINGYGKIDDNSNWFEDYWGQKHFTSDGIYMSPKNQDYTNKIFLEPKLCLYFFKLKAVN